MQPAAKIGRNDPCFCGSGRKYKHCCLARASATRVETRSTAAATARALQLARQHHQSGQLPQAEALYRQVLDAEPNQPDALHLLGLIAHQTGRNEVAAALLNRAIQTNGSDPSYYSNLGLVYAALDEPDKAIDAYRKALSIEPRFANAHNNLGLALASQGHADEAIACFRKAIEIGPDYADAHNNLGTALLDGGRADEAIGSFRRAIAIRPDDFIAHSNLGNTLLAADAPDQAIDCYRRALAIRPDYVEAHYNLGTALRDWGKPEEAAESLRTALRLRPNFAEAHNSLGAALQDMGRLEEAVASVRTALHLKPDYAEAHFNLHSLLLKPGSVAPAIECLEHAVRLRPEETGFRFFLGMLLDYCNEGAAAAEHFARVARGTGDDRARLDSWQYVRSAAAVLPPVTGSAIQAFRIGLDSALNEGLVLEFGVRFGVSIRQIAALAHQDVHGFDSFQGLPEDWHRESRGSYTTGGALPEVPANVVLHAGWFEDTLPQFLELHAGPVRFMNVDCDLYSSTTTVLELLADRIGPGTVIVFDEYLGYEHWREDEFKAFQEAVVRHGWTYVLLCFSVSTKQVAVRIT